ncbi:MAG: hypothetical protein R3B90_16655 [Planctomycetaceae bacterium]
MRTYWILPPCLDCLLNCCDENGFLVSSELTLVSTIGVLGLMAGLSEVQEDVNGELGDVGGAIQSLDQSYSLSTHDGKTMSFRDRSHLPQGF